MEPSGNGPRQSSIETQRVIKLLDALLFWRPGSRKNHWHRGVASKEVTKLYHSLGPDDHTVTFERSWKWVQFLTLKRDARGHAHTRSERTCWLLAARRLGPKHWYTWARVFAIKRV